MQATIKEFLRLESAGGTLLVAATILAYVILNYSLPKNAADSGNAQE